MCQEQPVQLDNKVNYEEPATKRAGKRAKKPCSSQNKKKVLGGAKLPPVRVSDNGSR